MADSLLVWISMVSPDHRRTVVEELDEVHEYPHHAEDAQVHEHQRERPRGVELVVSDLLGRPFDRRFGDPLCGRGSGRQTPVGPPPEDGRRGQRREEDATEDGESRRRPRRASDCAATPEPPPSWTTTAPFIPIAS